jgi:hypothetical protein
MPETAGACDGMTIFPERRVELGFAIKKTVP